MELLALEDLLDFTLSSGLLVEHSISGGWVTLPLLGVPELVLISKAKFALLSSAVPSSKEIKKKGGEMGIFGGVEAISVYNRH